MLTYFLTYLINILLKFSPPKSLINKDMSDFAVAAHSQLCMFSSISAVRSVLTDITIRIMNSFNFFSVTLYVSKNHKVYIIFKKGYESSKCIIFLNDFDCEKAEFLRYNSIKYRKTIIKFN